MKNFISFLLISLFLVVSCKTKKDIAKVEDAVKIDIPLSGKEYQSNDKFFRATSSGESLNLATSKKIALLNAKTQLASTINSVIKSVGEQFTENLTVDQKTNVEIIFDENAREVVNQSLADVRIINNELFKLKNDTYRYFVAIETPREAVLKKIADKISKDEELKVKFDKERFMKTFNEEMQKFEENQNANK